MRWLLHDISSINLIPIVVYTNVKHHLRQCESIALWGWKRIVHQFVIYRATNELNVTTRGGVASMRDLIEICTYMAYLNTIIIFKVGPRCIIHNAKS